MNKYGNAYKEREQKAFDEWEDAIDNPVFPVYILSGEEYWKKEIVDRMSETLGKYPDKIGDKLRVQTDKMRYRSIRRKKHFVLFESKSEVISAADLETLDMYLNEPSDNGVLIISLKDRAEKRFFLRKFSMIKKSQKIKFFDMDYVSDYFKKLHVHKLLESYSYSFESEKLRETTIKNLILRMSALVDNLEMLEALNAPVIGKDDVKSCIEEYSDNNIMKFYESLSLLNRKRVPYNIMYELLDDGMKPASLMNGIRRHFTLLYQAKYLKLRGILRQDDLEDVKKEIYLKKSVIFKGKVDIWEISKSRRNRYLEECDKISLRDIVNVLLIIDQYFSNVRYRKGDKYIYNEFVSKEQLMMCVAEILNRREKY